MTSRDPERSGQTPQYVENSWRCYLATVDNYYLVCCEAVRSAILATTWLLVTNLQKHRQNRLNARDTQGAAAISSEKTRMVYGYCSSAALRVCLRHVSPSTEVPRTERRTELLYHYRACVHAIKIRRSMKTLTYC